MLLRDVLVKVYSQLREELPVAVTLDIGTGKGENLSTLTAVYNSALIVTLDVDFSALSTLRESFKRELERGRLSPVAGDAEKLPFREGVFGLVSALASLHHVDDIGRALEEAHRVLAPEGLLVVVEWTPESRLNPHGPSNARRVIEELKELLPRLFTLVDLRVYRDYLIVAARK
ncbi:MAG: class I SAM-dependent methyltransferase [Thermofilum sp.]|uniref:Class I SAM-dependent methyltransferase n=1 Tax=Thermofilum pendens TaxID=2269 RepID=A0A7C4D4A6_THEPE